MRHKQILKDTFKNWLPLGLAIIFMSGLVYGVVQQNYRQNANDPQVQIAEDIITAIGQGTPASSIVSATPTLSIDQSLSPFVIIYDESGKALGSSVQLDGKIPSVPSQVLDLAKKKGQDRLTWQPKAGTRAAIVVKPFSGQQSGYILAGRLLTEIEKREQQLLIMTAVGAAVSLFLTFMVMLLLAKFLPSHLHQAAEGSEHHHAA